ncbi:MAG: hypothetical protein AAGB29_13825 [Planctomycetota bacterium]
MQTFYQTLGLVTPVVAAIILLALFFRWLAGGTESVEEKPDRIALKGVLNEKTLATVHLSGGRSFEQVRLIGFTKSESFKGMMPYELSDMLILEHQDGRRTLIPARSVRSIEIAPEST